MIAHAASLTLLCSLLLELHEVLVCVLGASVFMPLVCLFDVLGWLGLRVCLGRKVCVGGL